MAVSKRVRFEVLRRDGNRCRYCGASAADGAVLTIDHVTPVALGGSDDPSNLVTACRDCNAGKTSAAPDEAIVADVAADALRWAAAMKRAAAEFDDYRGQVDRVASAVRDEWMRELDWRGNPKVPPLGYAESVEQWLRAGLSGDEIVALVAVAQARRASDPWRYFAGCCWTRVRQLQERAAAILAEQEGERS